MNNIQKSKTVVSTKNKKTKGAWFETTGRDEIIIDGMFYTILFTNTLYIPGLSINNIIMTCAMVWGLIMKLLNKLYYLRKILHHDIRGVPITWNYLVYLLDARIHATPVNYRKVDSWGKNMKGIHPQVHKGLHQIRNLSYQNRGNNWDRSQWRIRETLQDKWLHCSFKKCYADKW